MSHLHLALLGNPDIRHGKRPLSFRTRKGLALLVYLAIEEGMHTRSRLAALFWPESDASSGRANLRTTLMYLRKTLAHDETSAINHLLVERSALGFNRDAPHKLDLNLVRCALDDQPSISNSPSPISALQKAVAAVRGEFMSGFSLPDTVEFDDWVTLQRESWHLRLNDCFDRLSQQQLDGGQLSAAGRTLQQWLAFNPLEERAYHRLMRVQYQQGDRSGALQTFARAREVLADELGVAPAPETAALAEQVRTADKGQEPLTGRPPTRPAAHFTMPLVGRAEEHRALAAALRQARIGETQLVIIKGEAGIGKTRLARDFLAWATARGAQTLAGRAYESGGRLPYQPVMDALRPAVSVKLSPTWLAELSRLLPQLRERHPNLPPPLAETQASSTRLFEAVVQLGQALAAQKPLLLLIDDVQWADASSLDLLLYTLRRWSEEGVPLMMLLTLRSEALVQEDAAMSTRRHWLRTMQQGSASTELQLQALNADVVANLVGRLTPSNDAEAFSRWLFAETGGHPFYIRAIVEALLAEGAIKLLPDESGAWRLDVSTLRERMDTKRPFIPPDVRDLIHYRLSQLTANAFNLLTAAAVLGQESAFRLLCRVADQSEVAGLAALDELTGARLLEARTESGRTAVYRFSHDKIRDVAYTEAGDARRQLFHERAFFHYSQDAVAPPARLAHHALAAGLTQPAFAMYLAAGHEAMDLFAVRDAIEFYEGARHVWEEETAVSPTTEQVHHLYTNLGRAYELSNRWQAADEMYLALLQYARTEAQSDLEMVALTRRAGVAFRGSWQLEQAVAYLEAARAIAEALQDIAGLVKIWSTLSQVFLYQFDRDIAVRHAEKALTAARELADEALIARSLNLLAYARFGLPGTLPQVETEAAEARALFFRLGNRALATDSLVMMAHAQTHQGRAREGVANLRQALAIAREIENSWQQVNVAFHLAFALIEIDELDEALTVIEEGIAVAQRYDHEMLLANSLSLRGTVWRAQGRLKQARADHAAAYERFGDSSFSLLPAIIAVHLCADCALAGDWDAALDYAQQALKVADLTWLWFWSDTGFFYHHVVEALWHAGAEKDAYTALARLEMAVGNNPRYQAVYRQAHQVLVQHNGTC